MNVTTLFHPKIIHHFFRTLIPSLPRICRNPHQAMVSPLKHAFFCLLLLWSIPFLMMLAMVYKPHQHWDHQAIHHMIHMRLRCYEHQPIIQPFLTIYWLHNELLHLKMLRQLDKLCGQSLQLTESQFLPSFTLIFL